MRQAIGNPKPVPESVPGQKYGSKIRASNSCSTPGPSFGNRDPRQAIFDFDPDVHLAAGWSRVQSVLDEIAQRATHKPVVEIGGHGVAWSPRDLDTPRRGG